MSNIKLKQSMIRLPSSDGHGEYDRYVLAPTGMETISALTVINDIILTVNKEDNDNAGECLDGKSVEENIARRLSDAGFTWLQVTGCTNQWDVYGSSYESPSMNQ